MRLPILLHTAVSCTEGILTVFTATILGRFADSVFRLDFSLSIRSAVSLGLALFAMIAFLPAVALLANMFMLKYALVHDRMIIGRFWIKNTIPSSGTNWGTYRTVWTGIPLNCAATL